MSGHPLNYFMKINSFNSWTQVPSETSRFIFALCTTPSYWLQRRAWVMGVRSPVLLYRAAPCLGALYLVWVFYRWGNDGQSSQPGSCHTLVMTGKGWKHEFLSMLRPSVRPKWVGKWQTSEEERMIQEVWALTALINGSVNLSYGSTQPLSLTWDWSHNSAFSFCVSVSVLAYVRAWDKFQWALVSVVNIKCHASGFLP